MRLRKHREDVASLKLMQDNYIQEIARRYLNIIRMAEEQLSPDRSIMRLIRKERVVRKDGGGK